MKFQRIILAVAALLTVAVSAFAGTTSTTVPVSFAYNSFCRLNLPASIDMGSVHSSMPSLTAAKLVTINYTCSTGVGSPSLTVGNDYTSYYGADLGTFDGVKHMYGYVCDEGSPNCAPGAVSGPFSLASATSVEQSKNVYLRVNGCSDSPNGAMGDCPAGSYNGQVDARMTF